MKKQLITYAIGLIAFTTSLHAQTPEEKTQFNILKINLLPLAAKTFSFEYERVVSDKFTVGAMLSFRPDNSDLPFISIWDSFVDDEETLQTLENTSLGAFSTAIEGRFYTGRRGTFRGFYLAPYIKYAKYGIDLPFKVDLDLAGTGIDDINRVEVGGDLKSFTAGLSVGLQFSLSKSVSLDWRILGAGYGFSSGSLQGSADRALTPMEQEEIDNQLDDLEEIPFVNMKSKTVDAQGVNVRIKGPWANLRTSLSIGYRF